MVFHPLYEKLQSIASITTIIFNKKILHEKCAKYALLWRIQHVELKTNLKVSRSGSNNEYPWINIYHVKGQIYLFEFGHCHVQHVLNSMVLKSILQWAAMISIQTKKKIYMCDFKISSITKNKKKKLFLDENCNETNRQKEVTGIVLRFEQLPSRSQRVELEANCSHLVT